MRLINAVALKKTFEDAGLGDHSLIESVLAAGVYAGIDDAPAIDAVQVVRCRDCVCCSMWNDQLICSRISDVMHGYYHGTIEVVKPDDYCSHGIRQSAKPLDGGVDNA